MSGRNNNLEQRDRTPGPGFTLSDQSHRTSGGFTISGRHNNKESRAETPGILVFKLS